MESREQFFKEHNNPDFKQRIAAFVSKALEHETLSDEDLKRIQEAQSLIPTLFSPEVTAYIV